METLLGPHPFSWSTRTLGFSSHLQAYHSQISRLALMPKASLEIPAPGPDICLWISKAKPKSAVQNQTRRSPSQPTLRLSRLSLLVMVPAHPQAACRRPQLPGSSHAPGDHIWPAWPPCHFPPQCPHPQTALLAPPPNSVLGPSTWRWFCVSHGSAHRLPRCLLLPIHLQLPSQRSP